MRRFAGPVAARYGSVVVQFVVVAVVTRSLSVSDAGTFFSVMGVVLSTYFIAGLGLPDGLVRRMPALGEGSSRRVGRLGLILGTSSIAPLACVAAVALWLLVGDAAVATAGGLWWAGYGLIFVAAQFIVASGRGPLGAVMFYSSANFCQLLVSLPLIALNTVSALGPLLLLIALGTFLAGMLAFVLAIVALRALPEEPRSAGWNARDAIARSWREGLPMAAGRLVQSLLIWSPVGVSAALLSAHATAQIGLASRLVSAVGSVIAAVRFSVRPDYARGAAREDWRGIQRSCSRIAFAATALALAAAAALVIAGPLVIPLAFGQGYGTTALLAAAMLSATVGESVGGPVDEVLKMSGDASWVLGAQVVALALGIPIQIGAAWLFGPFGICLGYGLAFVAMYVAYIIRLRATRGILILPRLYRGR